MNGSIDNQGLKTMIRTIAVTFVLISLTRVRLAQSDSRRTLWPFRRHRRSISACSLTWRHSTAVAWLSRRLVGPSCVSTAENSASDRRARGTPAVLCRVLWRPPASRSSDITEIQMVRPDVAVIEGRTTSAVGDAEPVVSAFAATLVKDGKEWRPAIRADVICRLR